MKKNVVIFKWNPAISSYMTVDFIMAILRKETQGDWSVWDHERIGKGDDCYLLKVGCGATGIVKAGRVTSVPYTGADWSGHGRVTYYVDFKETVMVNPDTLPILDSTTLEENIPDFDWRGGHSGVVLEEPQAEVFRRLWNGYLAENLALFTDRLERIASHGRHNDQLYVDPSLWRKLKIQEQKDLAKGTEE